MIAVYVVMVGPVDFFALRHLRRMELTWITFPAYVGVFSGIALLAGSNIARFPATAREIAVVDMLAEADVTRGWSLTSILTPTERTLEVRATKPASILMPRLTLDYGQDAADAAISDGRIENWYLQRGSTGIVVAKWCEKGCLIQARKDGASLAIENKTGEVIRRSVYITRGSAHFLDEIPPGASRHALAPPSRDAWSGMSHLGVDEPAPYDEDHWRFRRGSYGAGRPDEASLRRAMRGAVAALSFAHIGGRSLRRSPVGIAREMDATAWVESGGGVLMAWTDAPGAITIDSIPRDGKADTLLRVFVRHD
jgi:hypothetical protein